MTIILISFFEYARYASLCTRFLKYVNHSKILMDTRCGKTQLELNKTIFKVFDKVDTLRTNTCIEAGIYLLGARVFVSPFI